MVLGKCLVNLATDWSLGLSAKALKELKQIRRPVLVDMISAVKHGEGFGFHGCQTLSDLAFGLDTHGD